MANQGSRSTAVLVCLTPRRVSVRFAPVLQRGTGERCTMRTPQLLCSTLFAILATVACNRTTDGDAQRTSEQVKAAAVKAGHQLADSWLTTKIQAQYFADDDIKARHINVST